MTILLDQCTPNNCDKIYGLEIVPQKAHFHVSVCKLDQEITMHKIERQNARLCFACMHSFFLKGMLKSLGE